MKKVLYIIFLCIGTASFAQVSVFPLPIEKSVSVITEKNKDGIYKTQKVKGKITGSGLFLYKNGTLYVGDFNDKIPHGKGIFIVGENDSISNCPMAKYFIGKFKNGLKQGKGVCYNINGEVIYSGKFVNDCPTGSYTNNLNLNTYFADANAPDFYYIGEFEGYLPNGFGAIFFPDGDFLISHFLDGSRTGNSVYIQKDGNWISENIEGEQVIPISSSAEYASLVSQSKAAFRLGLSEAFGYFTQAVNQGAQIASQVKNFNKNEGSYNSSFEPNCSDVKDDSKNLNSPKSQGDKYNMSEQRSYNSDKSTYAKYDSMLAQTFAGNRKASASEIRNWQSKMKDLRNKWENKGKSFPHSSNEDK